MPVLDPVAEDDETCQLYPGDIVSARYLPDKRHYLASVELENTDGTFWMRWIDGGQRHLWAHERSELQFVHGPRRQTVGRGQGGAPGNSAAPLTGERLRGLDSGGSEDSEQSSDPSQFFAGDIAWARWTDKRWYMAHLTKDNGDGTFELEWFDNHDFDRVISAKYLRSFPFYYVGDCVRFYVSQARRASGRLYCLSITPSESSSTASDSAAASIVEGASASAGSSAEEASVAEEAWEEELLAAPSAAHWLILEVSEGLEADAWTSPELPAAPSAASWLVLDASEDAEADAWTSPDPTPPSTEVGGAETEEEEEPCMVEELAEEWRRRRREKEEAAARAEAEAVDSEEELLQPSEASEAALPETPPELAAAVGRKPTPPRDLPAASIAKVGKVPDRPLAPRAKAEPLPEPFPEPSIGLAAEVPGHSDPASARAERLPDAQAANAAADLEPSPLAVPAKQEAGRPRRAEQSSRDRGQGTPRQSQQGMAPPAEKRETPRPAGMGGAKADARAKQSPDGSHALGSSAQHPGADPEQMHTGSWAATSSTQQARHARAEQPSGRSSVLDVSAEGPRLSGSSAARTGATGSKASSSRPPQAETPSVGTPRGSASEQSGSLPGSPSRQLERQPDGSGVRSGSQLEEAARRSGSRLVVVPGQSAARGSEEAASSPPRVQHFALAEADPPTEEELHHLVARCQHFALGTSEPTTEEEMSQLASSGTASPLIRPGARGSATPSVVEEEEPELDDMYDFPPNYGRGSSVWGNFGRRFH